MSLARWREPTLDQLATVSEQEVVRRRFDERNVGYGLIVAVFATVASLFHVGFAFSEERALPLRLATLANVALALGTIRVLVEVRRTIRSKGELPLSRIARLVEPNPTPPIVAFLVLQFGLALLLAGGGGGGIGWSTSFPWFAIGFRFTAPRRLALHAFFALMSAATFEALPVKDSPSRTVLVPILFVEAGAFAAGAASTRKARKDLLARFAERRAGVLDQLRMRDELQYARRVQESLLPAAPPSLAGLDIAARSVPATEVGGDYWDCVPLGATVAFVSADVAGHGLASGMVLASLRAGVRLLRDTLDHPEGILVKLHEFLAEGTGQRLLVTAAVAVLDRESGKLRVASAAHPPLLLRRVSGVTEWIDLPSPPLGVRLPFAPATAEVVLGIGDLVLLHSDGAYEATNAADDFYGLERLAALVAEQGGGTADELCGAIVEDVAEFRGDGPQLDDLTLVVVRRVEKKG